MDLIMEQIHKELQIDKDAICIVKVGDRVKFAHNGTLIYGEVIKVNQKTLNVRDQKIYEDRIFQVDKSLCYLCLSL